MGETGSMLIMYLPVLLFVVGFGFYCATLVQYARRGTLKTLWPSKEPFFDFIILVLRWYLAYYMLYYGWGKMTGGQFGHRSEEVLNMPLREVDKFNLAWHLFSLDKTFDVVVGLTQILGAILLVINRTVLIGVLLLLPILGQILLIDVAFTRGTFGVALPTRLACMVLVCFLILYYYRERMVVAWNALTKGTTTRFKYPWWVFALVPLLGLLTDLVLSLFSYPIRLLMEFMAK